MRRAARDVNGFAFGEPAGLNREPPLPVVGRSDVTVWCDGSRVVAHKDGQRVHLDPSETVALLAIVARRMAG